VEFALNPGSYEIKLELEGYATLQKMVEVNAGKRIQVEETLTKKQHGYASSYKQKSPFLVTAR
jgi:uncharacterized membrane protein